MGARLPFDISFGPDGNGLESTLICELNGNTLAAEYHTRALADGSAVDDGTWKGTAL